MSFLTWRRRFIILFANAFVITVFLGIGYSIDRLLHTYPFVFILSFILSFPASLALLIRLLKQDVRREQLAESKEKL